MMEELVQRLEAIRSSFDPENNAQLVEEFDRCIALAKGEEEKPKNDGFGLESGGLPIDGRWNFPEDFANDDDNGHYLHPCACGRMFHGHKRRRTCKVCLEKENELRAKAEKVLSEISPMVWNFMGLSGDQHRDARRADYRWGFIEGFVSSLSRKNKE